MATSRPSRIGDVVPGDGSAPGGAAAAAPKPQPRRVAVVEDEPSIALNLRDALARNGWEATIHPDRPSAQSAFEARLPDLAIIDVSLGPEPEGGFALCRWLRDRAPALPILILSARDSEIDQVSGLRLGADDYVTKNVSLPHLLARVTALFRRADLARATGAGGDAGPTVRPDSALPDGDGDGILERGALVLDSQRFEVRWRGRPVALTVTEFWMLHALARHPGHVRDRDQLMREANLVVDDHTVTSYVKRLRRKFEGIDPAFDAIDTVHGLGYRWRERT
jgi:two-component system OmpR family response regulator